jgi:hypothetical protein
MEVDCQTCGRVRFGFEGVETHTARFDPRRKEMVPVDRRRVPGKGLYVRADDLGDADFFRVREARGWDFCTDRFKEFVEERGFSNVAFWEYGDVIE